MVKKKGAKAPSKAIKKAKATQKVERKEKKKASKSKADLSDEDDDQDLEGILEKVLFSNNYSTFLKHIAMRSVDATRVGSGSHSH